MIVTSVVTMDYAFDHIMSVMDIITVEMVLMKLTAVSIAMHVHDIMYVYR